jgi:uncharacterized SAM-binding protein YcdF (DUF218 family)
MYELITGLLEPYTLLLLSLSGLLVWIWRRERPRRLTTGVAMGFIFIWCLLSLPIVGYLFEGSLEWQHPPSDQFPTRVDTIVVLAGNADAVNQEGTELRIGDETLFRCLHALQLYRQAGGCRVIVSGGKPYPAQAGTSMAEAMRDFLVELGVTSADLVLEDQSTTTFENARNTCRLLNGGHEQRVFLVTTASHMLRAERCFARQGIGVVTAPCHHRAMQPDPLPNILIPSLSGITRVQRSLHEWLGLAWYWLRGRI